MLKMNDLLVVGAGHLGTRVAVLWRNKFPDCQIFLKTKTENQERSEKWNSLGYLPISSATDQDSIPKFPYVVFSVPPTAGKLNGTFFSCYNSFIIGLIIVFLIFWGLG